MSDHPNARRLFEACGWLEVRTIADERTAIVLGESAAYYIAEALEKASRVTGVEITVREMQRAEIERRLAEHGYSVEIVRKRIDAPAVPAPVECVAEEPPRARPDYLRHDPTKNHSRRRKR